MSYIYVAHGNDGLVKVGRTVNIKRRVCGLRKQFQTFGNELVDIRSFDGLSADDAFFAELRLIRKLGEVFEPYSGREWFLGSFEIALDAARITAEECFFRRPFIVKTMTQEEIEKRRIDQEVRKRREEELRAEGMRLKEARRSLRELRRSEIAARAVAA